MADASPLFYIVLGTTGSGRRELVADMVSNGNLSNPKPVALLPKTEADQPSDAALKAANFTLERWEWMEGQLDAQWDPDATHIFFFADGRGNPADQIEALISFLEECSLRPARVFTVVDSTLGAAQPALALWFEACVHYSDVVFMNRREGTASKWAEDFIRRFEKAFYPCLFERVKNDAVSNPSLMLEPEARRMSAVFDERIELEDETEEEASAANPANDRFLVRVSGARGEPLPDITAVLE